MGWLVLNDRRRQLEALVAFIDECRGSWPTQVRGDRVLAMLPGFDEPEADLPVELYEYGAHELAWEARLLEAEWCPGAVRLRGFARIRNVPTDQGRTFMTAGLVNESGTMVPLEPTPISGPRVPAWDGNITQSHDSSGFTVEVSLASWPLTTPPVHHGRAAGASP